MEKEKRKKLKKEKDKSLPVTGAINKINDHYENSLKYTQKHVDDMIKEDIAMRENATPELFFAIALAKFQSEMPTVEKNKEVSFKNVKFKYADLAQIWEKMKGPLTKYGFSITQPIQYEDGVNYIYTILSHCEGKSIQSKMRLDCVGNDIKAMGSAISYYRRYALCSLVGIVSDDDVNEVSIPEDEHIFEKSVTAQQLKILEDTLADSPNLRSVMVSMYGDLNKIPEDNFSDALASIKNFKSEEKRKDFYRRHDMTSGKTKYHEFVEEILKTAPNQSFESIIDRAIEKEEEFLMKFNEWNDENDGIIEDGN